MRDNYPSRQQISFGYFGQPKYLAMRQSLHLSFQIASRYYILIEFNTAYFAVSPTKSLFVSFQIKNPAVRFVIFHRFR